MKKFIFIMTVILSIISCKSVENINVAKNYYNSTAENSQKLENEFISELNITQDKFQQVKFFELNTTEIGINGYKYHPILIYGVGKINENNPSVLRLKIRHILYNVYGRKLFLFDKITFLYDNKSKIYSIDLSKENMFRDNYGKNTVIEKYDISLNEEQILKLEEIMKSDKVEYRLTGNDDFESYIYKEDQDLNLGMIKLYQMNSNKENNTKTLQNVKIPEANREGIKMLFEF